MPEAAAAKHTDDNGAELAAGRMHIWPESAGGVHVAAQRAAVRARVSGDGVTFDDGRLHGQGAKVHGKGVDTN